jgi:hypothetical protein
MAIHHRWPAVPVLLLLGLFATGDAGDGDAGSSMHGPGEPCLNGLGGVYLLVEPGMLIIDIEQISRFAAIFQSNVENPRCLS